LRGLKPTNKLGVAFGSHGWAGGGAKQVDEELEKTGITRVREPLTCVYKPDAATLDECRKLGAELADKVESCK
jgi:flavorubredoxin